MSNTPLPLLVFAGSTRTGSHNRKLAHAAAEMARAAGAQVTVLDLAAHELPLYNADLEARGTPAASLELKRILHAHPAWIVCSPEYNGSYTGLLKNTIDWVSSPVKSDPEWQRGTKPFEGKVVGLLSASPGVLGGVRGLAHLSTLLRNLQCWVAPKQFALGQAGTAFDPDGRLAQDTARQAVQGVVDQVMHAARALNTAP